MFFTILVTSHLNIISPLESQCSELENIDIYKESFTKCFLALNTFTHSLQV